jgi:3-deoxy-D-manno-octulosonic-acid transferase
MMTFLYQLFIRLFSFSVLVASLFNRKAALFVRGRKNIFKELETKISQLPATDSGWIWFHCASLGEFEQAIPLMEELRAGDKKLKTIVTFFSPSGYEVRKNYDGADLVFFLPMDTRSNVKQFLDIVRPIQVFFVKYDFWFNYLNELYIRKIPTYLVSANFRQKQFKGLYGFYLRKVLNFFTVIFVQNKLSEEILREQAIGHVIVSGDMRFDRVSQTVLKPKRFAVVEHFKEGNKILIGGSTWSEEEEIIAKVYNSIPACKFIIAPHEINEEHILQISSLFPGALRFSLISKEPVTSALDKLQEAKFLIIDNIGMLSNLYRYADVAFVGGGFGTGIHNIIEAVAFGVPVVFGPNHRKFPEAEEIIEQGGGFGISSANDFLKVMELLLTDDKILKMASMTCKNFIVQRKGAKEKILSNLK